MPISISPAGRSKIGLPAAGGVQDDSATPNERERSLTRRAIAATAATSSPRSAAAPAIFSASTVAPDAAAPRGVQRVLHGDVVVDQHGLDGDPLVGGVLGRQLEVHDVARVVLDQVHDAGAAVDGLRRGEHLVGHRRGEHLARAGGVEHPEPDEAAVQRLVTRAAAGDEGDLALTRGVGAHHDLRVGVDAQDVAVRGRKADERLLDDLLRDR